MRAHVVNLKNAQANMNKYGNATQFPGDGIFFLNALNDMSTWFAPLSPYSISRRSEYAEHKGLKGEVLLADMDTDRDGIRAVRSKLVAFLDAVLNAKM